MEWSPSIVDHTRNRSQLISFSSDGFSPVPYRLDLCDLGSADIVAGATKLQHRIAPSRADLRQRRGDRFKGPALRGDADRQLDERRADHQRRREEVAVDNVGARAALDQPTEQRGRDDAAEEGTDRIKQGNGEGTDLEW